ncbi:hypothetical protein EV122DRAFT_284212 [Schizophyllum commune]|nr:hypothetical protein K525DRAFT_274845 [Schizophyllum commune Loenen D]
MDVDTGRTALKPPPSQTLTIFLQNVGQGIQPPVPPRTACSRRLLKTEGEDCHSLEETPQMHAFNLAFNPVAQILICTDHRIFKQGRPGREIDTIEAMFALLGVPVDLRAFQPTVEPRLLIEGLNCTTVSPTAHVLKGIIVQRPNANSLYIRVEVLRARAHTVLEQLLTVRAALRDEIADPPSDLRLVNPLLRRTLWHKYMQGHSIDQVRAAARFPFVHELLNPGKLVKQYLNRGIDLLDLTENFVLQLTNAPTPEQGINNAPLHHHQEHETTLPRYSAVDSRLIATLLRRNSTTFLVPTSRELENAVAILAHCLEPAYGGLSEATTEDIHRVLKALWLNKWQRSESSQSLAHPTLAFLCMRAVKADDSYMEAKELMGVLARLTCAIRPFVLTELHAVMEEDYASEFGPFPSPDHRFAPTAGDQVDKARALLRWAQEHKLSTFAVIRSCQHYATSLAKSALGMPSVWWVDSQNHTEMLVRGHRLSLDHLRTIVTNLQEKIVKSFRFLTAGLPTDIDYDARNDDLRNNTTGYSVVNLLWRKSSNQFTGFAQRFFEDPGLGLTRHMSRELAMDRTRSWLEALARHGSLILVLMRSVPRNIEIYPITIGSTPPRRRTRPPPHRDAHLLLFQVSPPSYLDPRPLTPHISRTTTRKAI